VRDFGGANFAIPIAYGKSLLKAADNLRR
jgi:hypothetical protein